MQERRDSNLGSFAIARYMKDRGFYALAVEKSIAATTEKIVALYLDEENDVCMMKPLGKAGDINAHVLVAESAIFCAESAPAPKYLC